MWKGRKTQKVKTVKEKQSSKTKQNQKTTRFISWIKLQRNEIRDAITM